jgi:hypothetical protein
VERVKLQQTFSCAWLLAAVITMSAESSPKFVNFDRLCGELSFVTPVSGGGMDSEPLHNVRLDLYPWEEGIVCCRNSHPFFKTMTGKEGAFEFNNVVPGRYWLVVRYQRRAFQLPVAFNPASRTAASAACWQQEFHIDAKGHFTTGVRVEM